MDRIKHAILVFTLSLIFGPMIAQTDSVYTLSLAEAQDFAIDNYFLSKNAELDIKAAQKKVWETTAIGLPQVTGSAGLQYVLGDIPILDFSATMGDAFAPFVGYVNDVSGVDDPNRFNNYMAAYNEQNPAGEPEPITPRSTLTYGLTVSQLIFSGEYIVGLQASKAYKGLSLESYEKIKIDLRESIAGTYYAILILEANKNVLAETLNNLKLNLEHTTKYYEQGLVEDTDVDQLDLTVKRTENSLRTIENQIESLSKLFKYQLGLEVDTDVKLTDKIDPLLENNIINPTAYVFSLEDNIDYKMLKTQENLMDLSLKREKSTFLPSLAGFYQYSDKTEKAALDFTINHVVGLNLSVPILSSGMRIAKVGQARIELDKAQNMKDQEAQRLILTAQQSTFDYNTALQNYYNEKQNFDLSEKVFNKATARFKEGMVSSLELSIFNNQYLQAQLTYASAIQELLTAKIALDKAYNKL